MASGYLQFIAGDYKEKYTLGVAIVGGKDLICANMFGKKLKLANIASFEVVTEENVKKFGTTLGTAALGGVVFGGAGAVVGAIAGGNKNESVIVIQCFEGTKGMARADSVMMDAIRKAVFERGLQNTATTSIPNVASSAVQAPVYNQTVNVSEKSPKSKWTAFFLCLFLGILGVHKFYEGKVWWGVLYLFTYGLCFIGIIVDLIAILRKDDPYYVD